MQSPAGACLDVPDPCRGVICRSDGCQAIGCHLDSSDSSGVALQHMLALPRPPIPDPARMSNAVDLQMSLTWLGALSTPDSLQMIQLGSISYHFEQLKSLTGAIQGCIDCKSVRLGHSTEPLQAQLTALCRHARQSAHESRPAGLPPP